MSVLYILLLIPGVMFSLFSFSLYPALNQRLPMGLMLGTFLLPFGVRIVSLVLNRQTANLKLWRALYSVCAAGLMLFSVFWIMNGALDKSPGTHITANIRSKTIIRGRHDQYDVVLTSWVQGHTEEHFNVTPEVFKRCVVGKTASVVLHDGFFGIPWHRNLSPN